MPNLTYPGPDTIQRHQLPNGVVILIYENFASQTIVIDGILRVGALNESRAQAGLADFTASLLLHGTQSRDFDSIHEALESVGADLDFSSGRHATSFSASSLAEDLDLVLELLAQSLRCPTFPAAEVEEVRGQMITGLHMRADDTRRMAGLAFNELLYGDHPYGRSTSGYLDTIPALSRDDLANFHARHYGPRGMILTIVGAVKAETALAKIGTALGDWVNEEQGAETAVSPAPRPSQTTRTHVPMPGKAQADVIIGLPGPPRHVPDYLDASLMNTILGVFGMMGRIGKRVREEQGLAYYAYSSLQGTLGPTPWIISMGVAPDNVEQAITTAIGEIARIQNEPVPAAELADSQAYCTGSLPVSLETNSGLADVITDMEYYSLGLDYLLRYPNLVNAVTPERIQAAAQKYLSTDQLAIAVAGP
jgi:zinc protease